MRKYFFILGHSPVISLAEIKVKFQKKAQEILSSPEASVFAFKDKDDIQIESEKLGGIIKMGQIIDEVGFQKKEDLITKINNQLHLGNFLERYLNLSGEKINFGFSVYRLDYKISRSFAKALQKVGLSIKKELRSKGYSVRFVTSRARVLSSVIVGENKLIQKGADICLLFSKNKIFIGKTLLIQEYKEFSRRDYGRPQVDAKSGMLPPKLARIMVNLSQAQSNDILLDPFCGSGTVLQEALLLGINKVIGSDISNKAVKDTQSNLEWLTSSIPHLASRFQILHSDIQNLSEKLKEKVDLIVTEPFLGPPLKGNEPFSRIKKVVQEESKLYLNSFQAFKKILQKEGKIVIIFPIFKKGKEKQYLPILPTIEKIGFKIQRDLADNKRGGLIYSRPDQKVLREIFILSRA